MKKIVFTENPDGEFRIWEPPVEGASYIVGADIAKGLEAGARKTKSDHSAMCILRREPTRVVQVAEGLIRCEPTYFGMLLAAFGFEYNLAILNPERNIAESVQAGLALVNYPRDRWYQPPVSLSVTSSFQGKYFFQKTAQSQNFLIRTTIDYLARRSLVLRSERLLQELRTLQYKDHKTIATGGKDLTIALMMAVVVDATTDQPIIMQKKPDAPPQAPYGVDVELWNRMHGIKTGVRDVLEAVTHAQGDGPPEWSEYGEDWNY